VYDHDGQDEEDEIARSSIIWERLSPAADWFYRHTDGTRIGDGEAIPHHAHIIIGLREEVDRDWWNRAMQEMRNQERETFTPPAHWLEDKEETASDNDPDPAQPECLAPSRLDQHGATAQADGGQDAHPESDTGLTITQGKSASCTTDASLRSELERLRNIQESQEISSSQEISDIWHKAEKKLGCDRSYFKLVVNSHYLPETGSLEEPRQLFEIRWSGGAGGSPKYSKGSQTYREQRTQRRRGREVRQAEFKREMLLQEETATTTVLFRCEKFTTQKFTSYDPRLLWRHFHRWVRSFSGISREDQNFAKFDDHEATALWRCKVLGNVGGKTFRLLAPSRKHKPIIHWRFGHSPPTIPTTGHSSTRFRPSATTGVTCESDVHEHA
jgi:hypothetical protein